MKRCPSCQQTYEDDALSYCPADGTRLETQRAATPATDLQATIMAPPPPSPPPMSESFGAAEQPLSGYETNVTPSSSGFDTSTPPVATPSWDSIPSAAPQQQSFTASPAPDGAKRKPMIAYITIGASILIAGFLLFIWLIGLIAGIGGSLIHLLFVLALLIGFVGIAIGVFLLVTGKKQ
jgi:hypothetical protein